MKQSRSLYTDDQINSARSLCRDPSDTSGAWAIRQQILADAKYYIDRYTRDPSNPDDLYDPNDPNDADRLRALYFLLPDWTMPRSFDVSPKGCPVHGTAIYRFSEYPWLLDPNDPYIVRCPIGHERYPNIKYPDDGWGAIDPKDPNDPNDPKTRFWFKAYACHWHWGWTGSQYARDSWRWLPGVTSLSRAYALTGYRQYARLAIVMLDRIASVYPCMDYQKQSREGLVFADPYDGKILNHGWEADNLCNLAVAYDLIWDALDPNGPSPIDLPWRTAAEVRANIEAHLLEEGIDAVGQHKIYASCFGHQRALAMAAVVRQLTASGGRSTDQILHNIFTDRRNWVDQGLDYAIYNWVFKDGAPALTSPNYNAIWVDNLISFNSVTAAARAPDGSNDHPYDIFQRCGKLRSMFNLPLDLVCDGLFMPAEGDSGAPNTDWKTDEPGSAAFEAAYRAYRDSPDRNTSARYAWAFCQLGGAPTDPNTTYTSFESLLKGSIVAAARSDAAAYQRTRRPPASRFFDGYGMATLNNANNSVAASMFYGISAVHGHNDRLNIELFGHGRKLSPDLGYPDAMNELVPGIFSWTKNTISHNTVMIDETKQLGNLNGKVLRFHNAPTVHAVDVDAAGSYPQASTYRRTLVLVDVGADDAYLVDVFRVRGGADHVFSLHGPEGVFELTGADLPEPVTDGTLAGPDVAYGQLYDDPVLGQPGYHGSFVAYHGSGYSHLFNWQSIVPDKLVTGHWTLDQTPAAKLHVHIPPHGGQELVVADAYVSPRKAVPTILKYMLLRRPAGEEGSTFVVVWDLADVPLITAITVNDDPALGTGKDQTVVLSIERRGVVDTIAVAPQAGTYQAIAPGVTSDAAVTLLSAANGRPGRRFAAGGTRLSAKNSGLSVSVPPTINGSITTLDYAAKTLTARLSTALINTSSLVGHTVRVFNNDHSAVYSIAGAELQGATLALTLGGSDVFTGRTALDSIDAATKMGLLKVTVACPFNLAGMRLVTEDLMHTAKIVMADYNNHCQLAADADVSPFLADIAAGKDAWIADFGVGDQIEIERFAFSP